MKSDYFILARLLLQALGADGSRRWGGDGEGLWSHGPTPGLCVRHALEPWGPRESWGHSSPKGTATLPGHVLLHGRKAGPHTDSTQSLLLLLPPPPAGMKVPEQTWLQLSGADWSILLCAQTCSWHQAGTGVNRWVHRDTCCSCRPQWYRMEGGGGISFDFAGEWQKGCVCWGGAVRLPGWISPPLGIKQRHSVQQQHRARRGRS